MYYHQIKRHRSHTTTRWAFAYVTIATHRGSTRRHQRCTPPLHHKLGCPKYARYIKKSKKLFVCKSKRPPDAALLSTRDPTVPPQQKSYNFGPWSIRAPLFSAGRDFPGTHTTIIKAQKERGVSWPAASPPWKEEECVLLYFLGSWEGCLGPWSIRAPLFSARRDFPGTHTTIIKAQKERGVSWPAASPPWKEEECVLLYFLGSWEGCLGPWSIRAPLFLPRSGIPCVIYIIVKAQKERGVSWPAATLSWKRLGVGM